MEIMNKSNPHNTMYNKEKKASQGGFPANKKLLYTMITILIMAVIFIHSAMPADLSSRESGLISGFLADYLHLNPEVASFLIRKCAHFTEYMILGISLLFTMGEYLTSNGAFSRPLILSSWGIGTFYAVTDEIHQIFSPGRSCEFRDMCIDCAGVLTGILLICIYRKMKAGNAGS